MATTARKTGAKRPGKKRAPAKRAGSKAASAPRKAARAVAKKPAKGAAKLTGKALFGATKATASGLLEMLRDAGRRVGETAGGGARELADELRERTSGGLASHVRRLPIQRSIDIAVPVEVAWDEWMRLESLPEGAHRVVDIERDGDGHLVGRLTGVKVADDWEAEILDERENESFAWRSLQGSDCAGLVTFHPLSKRLTRVELQLDVVPSRLTEAAALALHLADHRAETELRIFKARLETMSPDEYEDELGDEEPEPEEDEPGEEPEPDEEDQEEE